MLESGIRLTHGQLIYKSIEKLGNKPVDTVDRRNLAPFTPVDKKKLPFLLHAKSFIDPKKDAVLQPSGSSNCLA